MKVKNDWHVIIITDTGREVPHFTTETRRRAREEIRNLRAHGARVKYVLRKNRPAAS